MLRLPRCERAIPVGVLLIPFLIVRDIINAELLASLFVFLSNVLSFMTGVSPIVSNFRHKLGNHSLLSFFIGVAIIA